MAAGPQRYEYALKAAGYALLCAGLAALLVSEALSPLGGVVFLGLLALSWRVRTDWPRRRPVVIFLAFGAGFTIDWLVFSSAVEASLHLLLGVAVIKLLGPKGDKDYGLLYAVSFLFLLISSVYTLSVLFLLVLTVYVFLGVLTFILFESRKAFRRHPNARFELRGYLTISLLMTGLVGLVAAPIFVAVPRTNWGLFRVGDLQEGNLSGFSDRVVLGDIGRIIQNRDLFMRFKLDRSPAQLPPGLKWRGVALDTYDGHAWHNPRRDYQPLALNPALHGITVDQDAPLPDNLLRQDVTLEPGSDVVFGLGKMLLFQSPQRGLGGLLLRDRNGSLRFYRSPSSPIRYSMHSDLVSRAERFGQVTLEPIPEEIRSRFLQLPQLDPRIRRLAAAVTADGPDPLSQALLLENYLKSRFGYSLENAPAVSGDPLAAFLFEQREGHCEFFATAMAVMLRTQGIPSRVINGFRLGEFNEWGGYWVVRQSDAHSWVEAYFPGAGWLDFDPTPAGAGGAQPLLGRWVSQMLDAVDLFWTQVVTFDRLKQLNFFMETRERLRHGMHDLVLGLGRLDPGRWAEDRIDFLGLRRMAVRLLPAPAAVALLLLLFRRRLARWGRRWRERKQLARRAPGYYREFLELLGRKGLVRSTSETPHEYAARLETAFGSPVPLELTNLYYRHRYGNRPPDNAELRRLRSSVRKWSRGISSARSLSE